MDEFKERQEVLRDKVTEKIKAASADTKERYMNGIDKIMKGLISDFKRVMT